jgi:aminopeptidase-like protein
LPDHVGSEAYELMQRLFPLCRSLTGSGVRDTFDVIEEYIPIERTEVPTGTEVFDWRIPDEWNIRDAYIAKPDGTRVVDFRESNLHVVSYSEPVRARLSLESMRDRLHTLPDEPDLIPYRTSYYHRTWGFCLTHQQLLAMDEGEYDVVIDSTLEPGHLTYAEHRIPGSTEDEVVISTYVCHPSLANDNLSGVAVATMLGRELSRRSLRYSYRIVFGPGTIGPLTWLHDNRDTLHRIKHGLSLSCLGDPGGFTYKRSRRSDTEIDRAAELLLEESGVPHEVIDWDPWGGDERQFCSPGFNLPVGCLMRTPHGGFSGYHTSADSLDRISSDALGESVQMALNIIDAIERNRTYMNLSPFGEPQLGRRGLFRTSGGAVASPDEERAFLWLLNLSDGQCSLLDVAARSGLPYTFIARAAERLRDAGLLAEQ